ncbi:hypothetical protein [Cohnella soli]|uniref:Transposase n=1 Tax=Cohnella soli TaxID=425005 RepID=A0ABW0I462_9BACL
MIPDKETLMEAGVERLREEIQKLKKERDALEQENLTLYRKLSETYPMTEKKKNAL